MEGPSLGMFSFVEKLTPELLMHAIMFGSATIVKNLLDKCPSEVRNLFNRFVTSFFEANI